MIRGVILFAAVTLVAALSFGATIHVPSQQQTIQAGIDVPGWTVNPATGQKYKVYPIGGLTWHSAKDSGVALGGHLATITDQKEQDFLSSLLLSSESIFLGASDSPTEGEWHWVTGEPWSYTAWLPGQPNNVGGYEDYLESGNHVSGKWNDVPDNDTWSFMVEWDCTHTPNLRVPSDFPTIQQAIDVACPGDTVLVEAGTYFGSGNTNVSFHGKSLTVMSVAGPASTIIDCQRANRAFLFVTGETNESKLIGFSIINGVASTGGNYFGYGGGIICDSASPEIIDCRFSNDSAFFGGAIGAYRHSFPKLLYCSFRSNRAQEGGGALCAYFYSSVLIDSCIFEDNRAEDGGALFSGSDGGAFVYDSHFRGNLAEGGSGGGLCIFKSAIEMQNCVVDSNFASVGAGISITYSSETEVYRRPEIDSCVFSRNSASSQGGGILLNGDSAYFTNCTIAQNESAVGGAILLVANSNPHFTNTIIFANIGTTVECIDNSFPPSEPFFASCDLFANMPADWSACISSQSSIRQNFSADPLFCDTESVNFGLNTSSPCSPSRSLTGNLIGAKQVSCGAVVTGIDISGFPLTHVCDPLPMISWNYFDLSNEPQDSARVRIYLGTPDQGNLVWQFGPSPKSDFNIAYDGAALIAGTTYSATIAVFNGTIWSLDFSFPFHMNTPPTAPMPYAPQWPNITVSTTPDLSVVNATDAENDTLGYVFEIYYDSMLTQLAVAIPHVPETHNPDSTSWTVAPPLTDNKYYYWRARAFDGYEYSPWSSMRYFIGDNANEPPNPFTLLDPPDSTGSILYNRKPTFRWTYTGDPDPYNQVRYKLELAVDPAFTFKQVIDSLYTSFWIPPDSLLYHSHHWWRVTATDQYGAATLSPNVKEFWVWTLGDVDHSNNVDIADLSRLIDYLYISFGPIDPRKVGDLDGDCTVDIADLSRMIDYLYLSLIPLDVGGCGP